MSAGARRAWLALGSLATLGVLGLVVLQVIGVTTRSSASVDVARSADGVTRLVVEVDAGDVEIRGIDADTVSVTGTVHSSGPSATTHEERLDGDEFVVRATCPPGPLSSHCGVDHLIEVPSDMAVVVRSRNTTLRIADLDGPLDATTSNADVTATRLGGSTTAITTSNGQVVVRGLSSPVTHITSSNDDVDVSAAAALDELVVHTSNARVDVVVPDTDDAYAIETRTSNGAEVLRVRTDPTASRQMQLRTSNDDITVSYAEDG